MARKKWLAKTQITSDLLKSREKRKWQIAFRRYVVEKNISRFYAPYFGLDIENIRKWFEFQFENGIGWSDFGIKWQFDHIIPVTYFDFEKETELKLCWNFINLRLRPIKLKKTPGAGLDLVAGKRYFQILFEKTGLETCNAMILKIDSLINLEKIETGGIESFIKKNLEYIEAIRGYAAYEFELLNSGREIKEIDKEIAFLKNLEK